jgi:hypothetical protein
MIEFVLLASRCGSFTGANNMSWFTITLDADSPLDAGPSYCCRTFYKAELLNGSKLRARCANGQAAESQRHGAQPILCVGCRTWGRAITLMSTKKWIAKFHQHETTRLSFFIHFFILIQSNLHPFQFPFTEIDSWSLTTDCICFPQLIKHWMPLNT